MPTKEIVPDSEHIVRSSLTKGIEGLLDIRNLKGAYGAVFAFVGMVVLVLQLPEADILRLKGVWILLSIPSCLFLFTWMFSSYVHEQKSRTKAEEGINTNLALLTAYFKNLFDKLLDERIYLENRFDTLDDGQKKIFLILEKRREYVHEGDTEKLFAPPQIR